MLRRTKEGKEKIIPISPQLEKVLRSIKKDGEYVSGFQDPRWYTRKFSEIAKKAAVGGSLHRLRHSVATHLLLNGTPIHVVKELLGHASIRTTEIYLHALTRHLEKAVRKLNFGKPT